MVPSCFHHMLPVMYIKKNLSLGICNLYSSLHSWLYIYSYSQHLWLFLLFMKNELINWLMKLVLRFLHLCTTFSRCGFTHLLLITVLLVNSETAFNSPKKKGYERPLILGLPKGNLTCYPCSSQSWHKQTNKTCWIFILSCDLGVRWFVVLV